jgi:hypothetical protein
MSKVKCPVCPHEAESYETLFQHLMQHEKADIVYAFLNHMQDVEVKLSKLETGIDEIQRIVEMLVALKEVKRCLLNEYVKEVKRCLLKEYVKNE